MSRLVALTVLELVANALGLLIAAAVLPGFSIDALSFVIVVAIFTVVKFIVAPLIEKLSAQYVPVLNGAVSLITTFLGLLITTFFSHGLMISGIQTWILATLIVWVCGLLAAVVLPMFLFRSTLSGAKTHHHPPPAA